LVLYEADPKLQFWKTYLRYRGKTGLLTGFSKSLAKTNQVLEQAYLSITF
jgi:hypothetical protein